MLQVPTATGIDGVSFPGPSFEHRHLTVEVRHGKLSTNSGHWFPSVLAANNLANSVTPDSFLGVNPSLLSIKDCGWTNSHSKAWILFLTYSLLSVWKPQFPSHMKFCHLHICLHIDSEGQHHILRFLWQRPSQTSVYLILVKGISFFLI